MAQIQKVKTAIVGCGGISDIFFKNFTERFAIIDLVKCCSRGKTSADKKAQQYGIESSTLEEILADPEIELIANLTPPGEHYATIKAALEAGKHVWTEKTITTDIGQTKELVALAKEKGLYFGCEPDHFMGSAWQCAREYIDGGIIGDVTSAVVSVSQNYGVTADRIRFATQKGGGPGYDFGIYLVTQLVSLFGSAKEVCGVMLTQRPERVHGDLKHPDFGGAYTYTNEDLATASILFENGAVAAIHINGNSILEGPAPFLIYGTAGVLSLPLGATFSGDVQFYRPGSFAPLPVQPAHG
ncbi:MAG: Gfo/Idh/MocA family oxidoreductase, partial [Oscillospiraceae bacterium]|nr:Gfo/Idh/MocA family oxidoreductase [Oscillospiraceae bacterium]